MSNEYWYIKDSKGGSADPSETWSVKLFSDLTSNYIYQVNKSYIIRWLLKSINVNMVNPISYCYSDQEMEYVVTEPESIKVLIILTYKHSGQTTS